VQTSLPANERTNNLNRSQTQPDFSTAKAKHSPHTQTRCKCAVAGHWRVAGQTPAKTQAYTTQLPQQHDQSFETCIDSTHAHGTILGCTTSYAVPQHASNNVKTGKSKSMRSAFQAKNTAATVLVIAAADQGS
jgi:hypothetical protein